MIFLIQLFYQEIKYESKRIFNEFRHKNPTEKTDIEKYAYQNTDINDEEQKLQKVLYEYHQMMLSEKKSH